MFTLKISLANESFDDPNELPKILREIAKRIERGETHGRVIDTNGSIVGTFTKS